MEHALTIGRRPRRHLARRARVAGVALIVGFVVSCGGGGGDVIVGGKSPRFTTITVASAADTLLAVGHTAGLTAVARNALGQVVSGVSFTWRSSNAAAISVDSSGVAMAVAPGTAVMTATSGTVSGTLGLTAVTADLTTIATVSADTYLQTLVNGLGAATKSRVAPMVAGLTTATQQGNLKALLDNVALLRTELANATDPTDRALLASIVLYSERIQTLLIL